MLDTTEAGDKTAGMQFFRDIFQQLIMFWLFDVM